jgi:hypothetical protein
VPQTGIFLPGQVVPSSPIGTGITPVDLGGSTAGSIFSSVAPVIGIANFINKFFSGRTDARKAEAAAQYEAAMQGMQQAGVNPFEIYSPDVVNEMLYTPEGMATLAGMYPGDINAALESGQVNPNDLSQTLAFGLIDEFMRNPQMVTERYGQQPASQSPAQSLAPVDYVQDAIDSAGSIWNDPSRILGVIFGPGGITGNIEWGGGTINNAPGTAPAIYTGSPAEGVETGVTTGNPAIDAAVRRVLGQTEGGRTTTMDVIAETVGQETGYPAADVYNILKDILEESCVSMPSPTTTPPAASGGETSPTQDQQDKVTVGSDPGLFEKVMDVIRG